MKQILLTQDKVALVDDDDYEFLSRWRWQARFDGSNWYAIRNRRVSRTTGKWVAIRMHRIVADAKPGELIDHIDRNTLNNQKSNLRVVTHSESALNRKTWGSSKYTGVSFKKTVNKWCAQINVNGRRVHLGLFPNTEDGERAAAKCYDEHARIHYGEFANLNFR